MAFPQTGDYLKMPVLSHQSPTISFVATDFYDITTDVNGNACLLIAPNWVSSSNTITVNGTANVNSIALFTQFVLASGPISLNLGVAPAYQVDQYLTGNFAGGSTSSNKFARARINAVSIEGLYFGSTFADGGLRTTQIVESFTEESVSNLIIPTNPGTYTNVYKQSPLRTNEIFSLACIDRTSNVMCVPGLGTAATNGPLCTTTGQGLWPYTLIWIVGATPSTTLYRIIVRRNIDVELSFASPMFNGMMQRNPVGNFDQLERQLSLTDAVNESRIVTSPPGTSPFVEWLREFDLDHHTQTINKAVRLAQATYPIYHAARNMFRAQSMRSAPRDFAFASEIADTPIQSASMAEEAVAVEISADGSYDIVR